MADTSDIFLLQSEFGIFPVNERAYNCLNNAKSSSVLLIFNAFKPYQVTPHLDSLDSVADHLP